MSNDITQRVRAKSVALKVDRVDKGGRVVPTRNHIVPLKGMATAKEAEQIGIDMAKEMGISEDRILVETYKKGEAPMEANPRHRGSSTSLHSRPSEPTEITNKPFMRIRRLFGGVDLPKTEEEKQQYIAEFEARKAYY